MKKVFPILISLCSLSLANVYEKLNDFAYEKSLIKILKFKKLNWCNFYKMIKIALSF